MRSPWIKHGFWNTLEMGLTRVSDAMSSLVLLWVLTPETFSKLALAQAIIAPLLFFFLTPETVIYRDYSKWMKESPSRLASRIRALRLFAWGKGQLAFFLCIVLALFGNGTTWVQRFCVLLWAFSLALAPQVSGPDREFLRLDLQLQTLNWITLYQKVSLLLGTLWVALVYDGRIELLTAVAVFSTASTAILARSAAQNVLRTRGASPESLKGQEGISPHTVLLESLKTFSIWQHATGVIFNWTQTMDLFFLGVFRLPARELGLYAAILKLANLTQAAPLALTNLFMIWTGRRTSENERERKEVRRLSLLTVLASVAQAGILLVLSPWILELLSHGRWSPEERETMLRWLGWILAGTIFYNSGSLLSGWILVRKKTSDLFTKVYLPWGFISVMIYIASCKAGGTHWAAIANLPVGIAFFALLLFHDRQLLRGK